MPGMGRNDFIRQGRKVRKAFGGAMRQSGFLAAAGIFALQHNIPRLSEDNERARYLGGILPNLSFVESVMPSETNILIFNLKERISGKEFLAKLKGFDIHALAMGPQQIRFVTHLDFTDTMLSVTEERLKQIDRLL